MHTLHKRLITVVFVLPMLALACASSPAPEPATSVPTAGEAPAFSQVPDAADALPTDDATTVESSISKVTVYSDRARVTRGASVSVGTTPTTFAFRRLPGWVDDGSVRVAVGAGRIVDVQVERDFLARSTDPSVLMAEEAHEELSAEMAALDDELKILDAQKAQIESIKAFSLEKLGNDTTVGNISVKSYGSVVAFISDSLRETAKARRAVQRKRSKLQPELEASRKSLDEQRSLTKLEETTVLVTLLASENAQSQIDLTYMLPGATWEPLHELRVSTGNDKEVEVNSYAVVTQTSGEDWSQADLAFSTQSTTESVRIPELDALTLGDTALATRRRTQKVSSFSRALNAYNSQNTLWNKVHQKRAHREMHNFEEVYQSNFEVLQVLQSKTVELFESLNQRGTTAHFHAKKQKRVRGDGQPVRVRIGSTTLSSKQKLVAAPEQSLNVARTLEMTNSSDQPFLPGKVALYQDGEFLGFTEIDFIADGETFALFLSVADQIKLVRKMDRKKSAVMRGGKRTRMQVSYSVKVENLGKTPTTLTLADRIPISQNKAIKVDKVKVAPAAKPDEKGLLNWELTLAPGEKKDFRIAYQVEYPPELILETRRKAKNRNRKARRNLAAEDQIMQMEMMLE